MSEYNGWKNYETWLVNLHWSNCQGTVEYFNELAIEFIRDSFDSDDCRSDASYALSKQLQEILENDSCDLFEHADGPRVSNCDLFSDLLSSAISEVDFYEIAEHIIEDNFDEVAEEMREENEVENE